MFDLSALSLSALADVHNQCSPKPVKKFSSKAEAVRRTQAALDAANFVYLGETGEENRATFGPQSQLPPIGEPEGVLPLPEEPALTAEDYEVVGQDDPALVEDYAVQDSSDPVSDEEFAGGEESAEAEVPFVKATKAELDAMDGPTRQAYRKARRKAARDRRKAS